MVYCANVVPFGLSIAPWIFTKVLRPVIRFCRLFGISVVAYLDDFLWAEKRDHIDALVDFARFLLTTLGFSVSEKKSVWTPTQILQFLGLLVNAERFTFSVPPTKVAKITAAITELIKRVKRGASISAQSVAVVCGHILSVRLAVAPTRVYTRALYAVLNDAEHWHQKVVLSEDACDELAFWRDHLRIG